MGSFIGFLATTFVGEKYARPVAYAILAIVIVLALWGGKCAYDANVISKHEMKAENKQLKREATANTNLNNQVAVDTKAAEQRKQEMDNATRTIPDQAPSARQRAIACVELRRQAKERRKPLPAC
jgi:hypothetical protein